MSDQVSTALNQAVAEYSKSPAGAVPTLHRKRKVKVVAPPQRKNPTHDELVQQYEFDVDEDTALETEPGTDANAQPETQPSPEGSDALTEPVPAGPKHPNALIRLARKNGLSDEEINEKSADEIYAWIEARDQARSDFRQPWQNQDQQLVQVPADNRVEEKPEFEDDIKAMIDAGYDEGLVRSFQKMVAPIAKQNKELQAELNAIKTRENVNQQRTMAQKLDAMFDGVGNETIFGKGEAGGSREAYSRRMAVVNEMQRLGQEDAQGRRPERSFETYFRQALSNIYPQSNPTPTAKVEAPTAKQKEWQEAGLARPVSRTTSQTAPGGRKGAIAVIERARQQNPEVFGNAPVATGDDDEF